MISEPQVFRNDFRNKTTWANLVNYNEQMWAKEDKKSEDKKDSRQRFKKADLAKSAASKVSWL